MLLQQGNTSCNTWELDVKNENNKQVEKNNFKFFI
jgi:hypothetical protein